MQIINTTAPISIENLKHYFADSETRYNIIYKDSELKADKLLVYLSNLEVKADIIFSSQKDLFECLKEYLKTTVLVKVKSLELAAIDALFVYKGFMPEKNLEYVDNEFYDLLDLWVERLDSLPLYNMSIIQHNPFEDFINEHEIVDDNNISGLNFVNLLKYENFYKYYSTVQKPKYFKKLFEEYTYKGANLYSYWAHEKNPIFLLTWATANGFFEPGNQFSKDLSEDVVQKLKEMQETMQ